MAINAIYPVSIGTCVIQIRLTSWVHPKWVPGDKGTRVSTSDHLTTMLLNEVQKQYRRAEAEGAETEVDRSQEQKIQELENQLSRLEKLATYQERVIAQE